MLAVIMQRIRNKMEGILSEAQAGFRVKQSTIDRISTLRWLAEEYYEFGEHLYICYVDYQKAFVSFWRVGLCHIMKYLRNEEKIVRLLEALYRGMECAVRVNGGLSDSFETMVGVLQGCILSPFLFSILLEVMVALALHGCGEESASQRYSQVDIWKIPPQPPKIATEGFSTDSGRV